MVSELEEQSRQLSRRWQEIQAQTEQAQQLPEEIEQMSVEVGRMREEQRALEGEGEGMNLPLGRTVELLEEREDVRVEGVA